MAAREAALPPVPPDPRLGCRRRPIWITAAILPGFALDSTGAAFFGAAVIALINAVLPPVLAALRLPFMLATGFLLVLAANAAALMIAREVFPDDFHVGGWGDALLAALLIAAVTMVLDIVLGTNDDDEYSLRVTRRIARRGGGGTPTDVPGIVYLEIDGLALPVLRDAMRDGSAPNMARWIAEDGYRLAEWETDLSSQTGASQAGILLGWNEDIPAFRWVEKESGRIMTCSSPADCAEIEQRRATGIGLLRDGGASRGNLLSGEADETILTVSRMDAENARTPATATSSRTPYVTRALVLFFWEVVLELTASTRAARRDIRPRGHRGGIYPLMRAALCVVVRDLIVFGVLTDMMRGRPAVYATFSSYDEVAHHSGLERAARWRRCASSTSSWPDRPRAAVRGASLRDRRPLRPRADAGRHLQAAPRLRARRAGRAVAGRRPGRLDRRRGRAGRARRPGGRRGDRPQRDAVEERGRRQAGRRARLGQPRPRLPDGAPRPDDRRGHRGASPAALDSLRSHPHVGWLLVRSAERGALVLGPAGTRSLATGEVEGEDPLAPFSPTAASHLARSDGFAHVADIMVGSFYDPALDEGCAFEELISFHGGLGGPQTRPFILAPPRLALPEEPILGAAGVHALLAGWRAELQAQDGSSTPSARAQVTASERDDTSSLR